MPYAIDQKPQPANVINTIPIVHTTGLGQAIGSVRMLINHSVPFKEVRVIPNNELPSDQNFADQQIMPIVEKLKPILRRPLGSLYLSPSTQNHDAAGNVTSGENPLANFVTDALISRCRLMGYPLDLAMIDTAFLAAKYPPNGILTYEHLLQLLPRNDPVYLYRFTPQEFEGLLEDNARRLPGPGDPVMERGYLYFSQALRYTLITGHSSTRVKIENVTLNGRPLASYKKSLLLACPGLTRHSALDWENWAQYMVGFTSFRLAAHPYTPTYLLSRNEIYEHILMTRGIIPETGARLDGRVRIRWQNARTDAAEVSELQTINGSISA